VAKTLILITNHFPFGSAEAFIETEYPHLASAFEKVIIISRDVTSLEVRDNNYTHYRINPVSSVLEKLGCIFLYLKHFKKIQSLVDSEIKHLKKEKIFTINKLGVLFHDLSKALITSRHIEQIIKSNNISGELVLYSYWLTSSALATLFVNPVGCRIKRISRAHGGDVYQERHNSNYLSFRNALATHLDTIFCISNNGIDYLKTKIAKTHHPKLKLARLGTPDGGSQTQNVNTKKLIVSCSFLVKVKRIEFLIDTLALINDDITWVHIGDGPISQEIKSYAERKLSPLQNITYQFTGNLSPSQIMDFYKNNSVSLFVNSSSSEGIPVTMMEAQSFGIPILGLDVGGISEIVNSSNGKLLKPDASPKEYSDAIKQMINLPDTALKIMRENARRNWSDHYNAEKNFSTFADQISSLHK
jgi:glycosyltransferase involved in cell wall biosynthesis